MQMALKNRASYKRYLADSTHGVPRETKRRRRRLLDSDQLNIPVVCTTTVAASTDDCGFHSDNVPKEATTSGQSFETVKFSFKTNQILE